MAIGLAIYIAIGAGLLAYEFSDDFVREDVAQMPAEKQLMYCGLMIFGWPLILLTSWEG